MRLKLNVLVWVLSIGVLTIFTGSQVNAQELSSTDHDHAHQEYDQTEALKRLLAQVHEKLVYVSRSEADIYMLRKQINQTKHIAAPHFPARVDRPDLTQAEAIEEDNYNLEFWLANYPDEVRNYVEFVNEVVNSYRDNFNKAGDTSAL